MNKQCYACKASFDTDTDNIIQVGITHYICTKCASTCFDCQKVFEQPILTEDNEPWCPDCINLFTNDREAWRQRWQKKQGGHDERE